MHVPQRINRGYARVQVALPIGSNALQSRIILLEILAALKFVAVEAPAVLSCTSPEDIAIRDRPYARPNRSKSGCSPTLSLKDLKAGPLSRKEAPLWTVSSRTMFRLYSASETPAHETLDRAAQILSDTQISMPPPDQPSDHEGNPYRLEKLPGHREYATRSRVPPPP
jgi:hypothetical protein